MTWAIKGSLLKSNSAGERPGWENGRKMYEKMCGWVWGVAPGVGGGLGMG